MSLLLDHPQEILDSILQRVDHVDLYRLCLVNKAFCRFAQPRLYARIEWGWDRKFIPPVDLLLRSLLEKPALGEWVQVIVLKGQGSTYWGNLLTPGTPHFDPSGVEALMAFVKSRGLPRRYANNWIRGLQSVRNRFRMDAYIACMLAMMPNIRRLRVEPAFAIRGRLSSRMFRAALSVFPRPNRPKLPRFEQLREVAFLRRIVSSQGYKPRGADDLTPFFYLPEVHEVSACVENTPYWRWPEHKPTLDTLTTLNIAFVHAKHLGAILSQTSNLKTLRWDWRNWPNGAYYSEQIPWINMDQIIAALQHVQQTLVNLQITGSGRSDGSHRPALRLSGSAKGLEEFQSLKTLELPLAFLSGLVAPDTPVHMYKHLPATVTRVALSDDFIRGADWPGSAQRDAMVQWMENAKTATPRLRRLEWVTIMNRTVREWYDDKQLGATLLAACGKAGVDLGFVQRPDFDRKKTLMWDRV